MEEEEVSYWDSLTEEEAEAERVASLEAYAQLKATLLKRTQRFSLALAAYLLLVSSGEVAACGLVGSGVSYAYLLWLMRDVDSVQPGMWLAMAEADKVPEGPMRNIARAGASYSHSLQPRLLCLIGLVAAMALYNANAESLGSRPLTLIEQGAAVGGFLSYKVALILQVYEELKPKYDPEELLKSKRPALVQVEDVSLDLKELLAQAREVEQQQQGQQEKQQQQQR